MIGLMNQSEFARRRRALMARMEPGSIAILPAAPVKTRNRDADYPYRQDSDFYYLTGFGEPDAVAVLVPGRTHGEYILFVRDKDPQKELWDGYRAGPEGATADFGADDAFPIKDIDEILPGLIEGREKLYYAMGCQPEFDAQVMEWVNSIRAKVRAGAHPPGEFVALDHHLHDLRLFKSSQEIKIMKQAAEISARAHVRAMEACKPGLIEYQLEAEILHEFHLNGARSPAYTSIVGGGDNACVLHYIENQAPLKDGQLVLIDAGCELDHYAADITRTFPVNGRFSEPQKALYEVVLRAQLAAIEQVQVGLDWDQPHQAAVRVITEGLVELGLLVGDVNQLIEEQAYSAFFMHRTGHWLGMDVHDVGDYKVGDAWRALEPGMVLTVEPGIYVAPNNESVDAKWRGIGIRIEDDVLVTREGPDVLTTGVPKTIGEIEALMS